MYTDTQGTATVTSLSGPSSQMSQSLLFPWCFLFGRYPSELPQLHQRGISQAKKGRREKIEKEGKERELCSFSLFTSPWGFQLWRWGWSKQFCLSCFCCSFISWPLLFQAFLFFLPRNRRMINADPLPIYFPLSTLSHLFWEDSPR